MFLGKFFCGLDNENRFKPPDEFIKYLSDEFVITQGFDRNLWVLSDHAFQALYNKLGSLSITDPMARMLFRLILGAATETGITDQGLLKIPDELLEYAQIENDALLIGQGDYFEIWSPEFWNNQEEALRETETNIEKFSTFEITTR